MISTRNAALSGSLTAAILIATGAGTAAAQSTIEIAPVQIPLSDVNCAFTDTSAPNTVPPCEVNGTRDAVFTGQTRADFAANPALDVVRSSYDVTFDGNLQVDGRPIATGPGSMFPGGGVFRDAEFFFDNSAQNVDLSASYTGVQQTLVSNAQNSPTPAEQPAYFNFYENITTNVRSINVDYFGDASVANPDVAGETLDYDFRIRALDPTAVNENNSVAIAGTFGLDDDINTAGIQLGKIEGTARLNAGQRTTPYPNTFGDQTNVALFSPFQLELDLTATLTTVLNADGLITPTISVTDGINLNNSRITNLADAVHGSDAVTLAQLQAAIGNLGAGGSGGAVTGGGGAASTASGTGALAGGDGSSAMGAGAVSLGLGNAANGSGAVAIGDPNLATGTGAVAIGADNTATGDGAVALGNLSTAIGNGAVALGNSANAGTAGSVALGGNANASAANSVALGNGAVANQANTVSVGASGSERRITNVAAGTAPSDAVTVAQLGAETSARNTAIATVNQAIMTEANTRAAADTQLGQRIGAQESMSAMLATGLTNEQNARIAGDSALSLRLDGFNSQLGALDTRVNLLDDRISSSTAIATAMGGNAFLPNMKFNLTANVATYDGAHAGSLQIGALVTDNVAVNAGVATGFNRNGSTAARAGMTFGF